MQKEPLLFLCHRIPFPPNKGDKIRSFNILKRLSEDYDIHLGCFIDDPFDKQYVDSLKRYCASIFTLDQHKTIAKIKGLSAFLTAKPITLPYYYDGKMQRWVNQVSEQYSITKIFVYSSSMAQYCQQANYAELERVIDFVDVDSDKWRQYAEKKSGLAKWLYQREHHRLAAYEDKICADFSHSLFVSPDEAELFRQRQQNGHQHKVHGLLNGVDLAFFRPEADFEPEQTPTESYIAFTGAMDYWANIDAVLWFVDQVWPLIKQKAKTEHNNSNIKFCIVGGNPSSKIKALARQPDIVVTGRVHDIRPYIANASCVVAPLRIARGIQNKVLEAMALDKPIVCTSMAMEGINAKASPMIDIYDQPEQYADACLKFLNQQTNQQTELPGNRNWVERHFSWQQTLAPLGQYFSDVKSFSETNTTSEVGTKSKG